MKRKSDSMDYMEAMGGTGRSTKIVYYGNLFWIVFAIVLLFIIIIILALTRSNSQSQTRHIPASQSTFSVPDMTDILTWGYNGHGVKINVTKLFPGHREEYEEGFIKYHLNKYLSDRISMRRPLPAVRSQECQQLKDLEQLPRVSVVVVFRNEPRTTLLRMLYSVVDRSPLEIINDIILVDDNSDIEDLKFPRLEHYLSGLKKVSIIRLSFFHGVARARMYGARKATGDVIIFLQPRCECTSGWMVPLLHWIAADPATITVPVVDRIDFDTFQYNIQTLSETKVGSFTWELSARRRPLLSQAKYDTQITPNPVIVDGIFAVNRSLLFKLGGFDEGLMKEESVNIEFSFRSWMCGSQIKLVPCSHVGYIFPMLYSQPPKLLDKESVRDRVRIAEIWMSDYKYFVYERMQMSTQLEVQQSKSYWSQQRPSRPETNSTCQNFDWYLQKVEPNMHFPMKIKQRGRITLFAEKKRILSIGVENGNIILQDWVASPQTIWYHLRSGALITENKTCLSYTLSVMRSEKRLHKNVSLAVKSNGSQLESSQDQYEPDRTLQRKKIFMEGGEQEEVEPGPFLTESFQQQLQTDTLLVQPELLPQRRKLNQLNPDTISNQARSNRQNIKGGGQEKSTHIPQQDSESNQILIRNPRRLYRILQNSELASLRVKNRMHSQSLNGTLTFSQEQDTQPQSGLVMKPCVSKNQDERWIYTEMQTLQHVKSGRCMEAHKSISGKYFLAMGPCGRSSWPQQWSFISTLV